MSNFITRTVYYTRDPGDIFKLYILNDVWSYWRILDLYTSDMGWGKHEWNILYAYRPYMNKLIVEYTYTYNRCKIYTLAKCACTYDIEVDVTV